MEQKPIRESLFTDRTRGDLVGFRCVSCKHVLPPLSLVCYYCRSGDLEQIRLSNRGVLYSFTAVYQPHKHFQVPYTVGYVDLPEGVRFFSPLKEREGVPFEVGMDMELVIDTLWEEDNKQVVGPYFRPL